MSSQRLDAPKGLASQITARLAPASALLAMLLAAAGCRDAPRVVAIATRLPSDDLAPLHKARWDIQLTNRTENGVAVTVPSLLGQAETIPSWAGVVGTLSIRQGGHWATLSGSPGVHDVLWLPRGASASIGTQILCPYDDPPVICELTLDPPGPFGRDELSEVPPPDEEIDLPELVSSSVRVTAVSCHEATWTR